MITKLTKDNFETETKGGLKLVEFFADWCGYCKKQEAELEQMDKVWIGKVNADDENELAIKHGIAGFPTFLVMKDGKEVTRFSGLRSKEELMNILMKFV